MSDAPATPPTAQRPRDAATLVVIDRTHPLPRILMGRRRPDQIFLPDKYVFPGGRTDKADRYVTPVDDLTGSDITKLLVDMKGKPSAPRARALALTAIRETYEEAGLLFAKPGESGNAKPAKSANPTWQIILNEGLAPSLSGLRFLARAITPPGRTRRYDTRFFTVDASHVVARRKPLDNELLDLDWFTVDEMRLLDLPHITRAIVEDLADTLKTSAKLNAPDTPIPYYYYTSGTFERVLIQSPTQP